MSLIINNKQITEIYHNNRAIGAIYRGTRLIWQKISDLIKSCFSNDYWDDDAPWLDDATWEE